MIEQLSPEWFEQRKGRVTGSMVGAILDLSPFMAPADAMRAMVRSALGAETEFTGNVATQWGNLNEHGARGEYELEACQETTPAPFVPYEDWLGASPDAYVGKDGLLEIKCPYSLRLDKEPAFKPLREQAHYYAQVQVQLFVTDRKWCHFWQWAPFGTKLERIERDDDWLGENVPLLKAFHDRFLTELENPDHLAPRRVVIDTPDAAKMAAEYDELAEQIERAEERRKDLLADMTLMAGERDALFAGRKLTQVKKEGSISYAKIVKEKLPDLDVTPWCGKASSYWRLS